MAFNNSALAATLQRREKGYTNVISSQIPTFYWFKKKGRYKSVPGGNKIEFNLEYALDSNEPSFGGYDTLPVYPSDTVQTLTANWKNYYKSIAISGEEKRINRAEQVFKLLEQKEKNALESLQQQFNDHIYQDGTLNDGKRITGLKAIVPSDATTGTLFGLARSGNTFWQSYKVDTNAAALDISDGNPVMWRDMDDLWIKCSRLKAGGISNKSPDIIICTETYYKLYKSCGQILGQRFVNTNELDAGFTTVTFNGATMFHDEDMPADAGGDAQAYFLNSRFMELVYHPDADFKLTETQEAVEQDAFSRKILWMGELLCTNVRKQGIHEGVQAVQA